MTIHIDIEGSPEDISALLQSMGYQTDPDSIACELTRKLRSTRKYEAVAPSFFWKVDAERVRLGMNQTELCECLGVPKQNWYSWRKTGRVPREKLGRLAMILGVSQGYLLQPDAPGCSYSEEGETE